MTHRSKQQDERRQAEYWKQRALEAEAQLKRARDAQRFDRLPVPVLGWGGVKCDNCMSRFCECAK